MEQPQDTEKSFQDLVVYPNPAREQVSIVYSAAAPAELVISDLHGRILHRQSTNPAQSGSNTTSTISLRTYPPGVYHVQLTTATTRRNTLFLVY
ncbi:MAG: T9SS type A sorting domain-containing protein [Ignavibacteriae bacterium]|nr:T9SS type A sorting domain-containing protein [Ignavibacteriota bacterium]